MFKFKPASQFLEQYYSALICGVSYHVTMIFLTYFSVHLTNQLSHFEIYCTGICIYILWDYMCIKKKGTFNPVTGHGGR
jgi:hypothetical protein